MKVLFLDVDGVLNCHRAVGDDFQLKLKNWVQPWAMKRLNRIVRETGAVVVVSSTWRKLHTRTELAEDFAGCGFEGVIYSKTPSGRCSWHEGLRCSDGHRGAEIAHWLEGEPREVESFAILDDSDDMGPLLPHLIKVDSYEGLQDSHVEAAIAALGRAEA